MLRLMGHRFRADLIYPQPPGIAMILREFLAKDLASELQGSACFFRSETGALSASRWQGFFDAVACVVKALVFSPVIPL